MGNKVNEALDSSETSKHFEKLRHFQKLFTFETSEVDSKFYDALREAPAEIINRMVSPLDSAERIIESSQSAALRNIHERQFKKGLDQLELFNSVCKSLNNEENVLVRIEPDKLGGISMFLKPAEGPWGDVGGEEVDEIQIVIRNGSNKEMHADAFTQMQLNVRMLNAEAPNGELSSFRLDVHNSRNAGTIELDANLGGDVFQTRHQQIKAFQLGENTTAQENFDALQATFLLNFATKRLLKRTEVDGKVRLLPKDNVTFESEQDLKLLKQNLGRSTRFLRQHL